MHVKMAVPRTVAVVYAPQGGMGDVGKLAVAHALKMEGVTVKACAMTSRSSAPAKFDFYIDVASKEHRQELQAVFHGITPLQVVLEDTGAQEQLQSALAGADAVIVCIANRQPGRLYPQLKAKWGKPGMEMIGQAMQAQGVNRLVLLNSMGVYDDFLPAGSFWKFGWAHLMKTKGLKEDLHGMEDYVTATDLDYILVRVSGLLPHAKPKGEWQLMTEAGQPVPGMLTLAKSDAAQFLVSEAVAPSFHRRAVSIGGKL